MDDRYVEELSKGERSAWGICVFIRLWLTGVTRSGKMGRTWTISQMAILFEVTQAALFRDEPHTVTTLSKELNLPTQTVSRIIRELLKSTLVTQRVALNDARKKYIYHTQDFFTKDALLDIVDRFTKQWYAGNSWDALDKAFGAEWYFPMSKCSDPSAAKHMKRLREKSIGYKKDRRKMPNL